MKQTLKVYSSHRSLIQHLDEGILLEPHMMMSEFFSQIVIIKDYRALPQAMRLPISMQILKSCAEQLQRVNFIFEESFLAFLESSQFLFGFFDELSQAQVCIEEIPLLDTYGDYEDHLYVLEWIQKHYKAYLEQSKYYDGLILPPNAHLEINETFISHFESIDMYVEGIISKAHLTLLSQVACFTTLRVHFCYDDYNASLPFLPKEILEQCTTFNRYSFDFKTAQMLTQTPISFKAQVRSYSFALRISQVALVFYMLDEWLKNGVKEEDIVIIVPDEQFTQYLLLFDKMHNLNFAMGRDITHSLVYQELQEMLNVYRGDSMSSPYERICEEIQNRLETYMDRESQRVREYVSEILFIWESIGFGHCKFVEILELLLEGLKEYRIDDVTGGKIRVMGVLESRGFMCKKVIIVDFNEGVIPSVAQSDLFLNSHLRESLKMPTIKDKENLQKHYYSTLFNTADEIVLSYVENDDKHKSLLLEELSAYIKAPIQEHNGDKCFTLLAEGEKLEYQEDEMRGKISLELSPSKLKVLLECPRKYFYQYVEYLSDMGQDRAFMGNVLHECLESVYCEYVGQKICFDIQKISRQAVLWLNTYKNTQKNLSALQKADIRLLEYEIEQFLYSYEGKSEVEILCLEKEMQTQYEGFRFKVRPDRIQKNGECIEIIDYKYRKNFKLQTNVSKMTDFALLLYKNAFKKNYPQYASLPVKMYYWNIKDNTEIEEEFVAEKEKALVEHLATLQGEICFSKTETRSNCHYCPFTQLCDR